jgi:hypothetical protein
MRQTVKRTLVLDLAGGRRSISFEERCKLIAGIRARGP